MRSQNRWRRDIVEVTGRIASGKSTVVDMMREVKRVSIGGFTESGYMLVGTTSQDREPMSPAHIALDELAKKVQFTQAKAALIEAFPELQAAEHDAEAFRKTLIQLVSKNPQTLSEIEKITHGFMKAGFEAEIEAIDETNPFGFVIVERPAIRTDRSLYEPDLCIAVIQGDSEVETSRIQERHTALTRAAIDSIREKQYTDQEVAARSNVYIANSGDMATLRRSVAGLMCRVVLPRYGRAHFAKKSAVEGTDLAHIDNNYWK